jgi:protein transport protein SEC13
MSLSDDGQWDAGIFTVHAIGYNAVSWAPGPPGIIPGSLITSQQAPATATIPGQPPMSVSQTFSVKRFASAGCDNLVKIWGYDMKLRQYELSEDEWDVARQFRDILKVRILL